MQARRAVLGAAAGACGIGVICRARAVTSQQGQASDSGGLRNRGAPTGRTGAATRGSHSANGDVTVQLVAPLRGVGLALGDQPNLYYVMQGRADSVFRLTLSTAGQPRPLADFHVPLARTGRLGMISLRAHRVHLVPNLLCVWSLTLALNPRAPSEDLVCSALIKHQPGEVMPGSADSLQRRTTRLAQAGYWYDAVELAEERRESDGGAALSSLFEEADLPPPMGASRP